MVGGRTSYRSYNGTYYARTERKKEDEKKKKTLVVRRKIHKEREGESENGCVHAREKVRMDVFTRGRK